MVEKKDSEKLVLGYIAGSGHSGSTLTDILLGTQAGVSSFGELKNLADVRDGGLAKGLCTCGAELELCNVWGMVLHRLQSQGFSLEMNNHKHNAFKEFAGALLAGLRHETQSQVIVESSKGVKRFSRYRGIPWLDAKLIHLVRDGRAVAFSNQRKGRDFFASLETWVKDQQNILRFKRRYLTHEDYVCVRYEDLVQNPSIIISDVVAFLSGTKPQSVSLQWASRVRHNIGGNRMRRGEQSVIKVDDEYKRSISDSDWERCWDAASEELGWFDYGPLR